MDVQSLLAEAKGIWGERKLSAEEICVRLGVGFGDICRYARGASKDAASHTEAEIKKELGNLIFSTIRWCDDLGFDPEECVTLAINCQKTFAEQAKT